MNELSLYILDIAQNSVKAKSKTITINIDENIYKDLLKIEVIDDGIGMSKMQLAKVTSPFYTSRTTRKVGLGIPLFKEMCETCLGDFYIESQENVGTKVVGTFKYSNIDRPPLGDIEETIYILAINDENIDIIYNHLYNEKQFTFNTKEIKEILNGVSLKELDVMLWIKDYLREGLKSIKEEDL